MEGSLRGRCFASFSARRNRWPRASAVAIARRGARGYVEAVRTLELPAHAGPRDRGVAHGRALAAPIHEIAAIRESLACEQGRFESVEEVREVAALHLAVLERYDAALYEELDGIARGAEIDPARVVVINHYTDLKDLDPRAVLRDVASSAARLRDHDEDCSAIVAGTTEGGLLGQTWDMHGSAEPYVIALHVPRTSERPAAWMLSIAGCLGMAGMNEHGVGVAINNLRSDDARLGLVWPALVRRALCATSASEARDEVLRAPLGSGHHYLVADASRAYGIETSGTRRDVWAEADLTRPGAGFHHENHCLGARVAEVSSVSPVSTTLERHALIEASLAARAIDGAGDLWSRLASHEGYPRSVCTHLASDAAPHAMKTCGGIVMELAARRVWLAAGCLHAAQARVVSP